MTSELILKDRVRADSRDSELSELYCGTNDTTFWITDHEPSADGGCSGSKDPSNQSTLAFLLESPPTSTIGARVGKHSNRLPPATYKGHQRVTYPSRERKTTGAS